MSCTNCYTTNSATPCGTVGCLSTNYSKCILYSGNNLYCQTGTIQTVNFSGVAVSPVSDTTVTVSCTGGTGSGATFSVTRTAGFTTYTVSIVNKGLGYTVGDILTILGTSLGGTSSNNILVVVSGLTPIISNSDSIDQIILNLHQRLCLTSTSGLDYSTFNYSCLRVGGILTGIGTTITTAQQFTESTAAALCALNTRVIAVEKPALTVAACFTGTITSGTTGLASILTQYGTMLCAHNTNLDLSAVTASPCVGYAFTAKPTSNNVREYVDWITTNMCGMFTAQGALITTQTSKVNALYTYITGSTSGAVPASVDTSCLSGGSLTSNLKDAIVLIKNNLCSLNTTVAGLGGSSSLTLSWQIFSTSTGDCGGTFNNTPYYGLSIIPNSNTLVNHLNNIIAVLNKLRMGFSPEFVVINPVSNSCGTYTKISLQSGNNNDVFVYDTAVSQWINKSLNVTLNGSSTGVTKTVTSGAMTFNLTIPSSITIAGGAGVIPSYSSGTSTWTIDLDNALSPPVTAATSASFSITQGPFHSVLPSVQRTVNQTLTFKINHQVKITNISGVSQTLTDTLTPTPTLTVFNIASGYRPTSEVFMDLIVKRYNGSNVLQSTSNCLAKITSTGDYSIINNSGTNIVMASNDYLLIYVGGTWSK